jgi:hypothetical protein
MRRSTLPALCATLLLLGGCGSGDNGAAEGNTANAVADAGDDIEALPSDGLAAPEGMPLESESNAIGSASGGNAM